MVQVSENPLSNHIYNPDFEGLEYQNYIENTKNSCSEEQFDTFFQENAQQLFGMWKRNVFNLVFQACQIHLDDLPDFPYRMNFDENVMPHQMAQYILDNIP